MVDDRCAVRADCGDLRSCQAPHGLEAEPWAESHPVVPHHPGVAGWDIHSRYSPVVDSCRTCRGRAGEEQALGEESEEEN